MAFRYVYGETNPVAVHCAADVAIEIGDLCYFDSTDKVAYPAQSQADGGTLAANQEAFHDNFLGVARQQRLVTETVEEERVFDTEGVFDFPLRTALSADVEIGTLFGINEAASGTALEQSVIEVATENLAIGRLVERALDGATTVRLKIISTKTLGGPQAAA